MEDALPLKSKELRTKTSPSSCQNDNGFFGKTPIKKKKSRHLYIHVLILVAIKVNSIIVRI